MALAFAIAAIGGSFLVSYARAKAELLGLRGDVGIGSRAERVVVITAGLVFAPWGGLQWAIYFLAATAWLTVLQRILHVRRELQEELMASTNGKAPRRDDKVRVALIGVGNCASSLVQGVEYYKDADPDEFVPGLMHVDLGGYHVRDVEFTAAFDVTTDKVGKDLSEAIWAHPNNTIKFSDVPKTGVTVSRGHDPRRARQVPLRDRDEGAGRDRRRGRDPQGDRHRRRRQLPPGRLRGGDQVVHGADPRPPAARW